MALPPCTICGDEQPLLVQGDATTGDQTFVGPACLPGFMLIAAAELTKDQPAEWWAEYGAQLDVINASDRRPDKPPTTGKRKPRAAKQAPDGAEAAAGPPLAVAVTLDPPCPTCQGTEGTGDDVKLTCNGCGSVYAVAPAAED